MGDDSGTSPGCPPRRRAAPVLRAPRRGRFLPLAGETRQSFPLRVRSYVLYYNGSG